MLGMPVSSMDDITLQWLAHAVINFRFNFDRCPTCGLDNYDRSLEAFLPHNPECAWLHIENLVLSRWCEDNKGRQDMRQSQERMWQYAEFMRAKLPYECT